MCLLKSYYRRKGFENLFRFLEGFIRVFMMENWLESLLCLYIASIMKGCLRIIS